MSDCPMCGTLCFRGDKRCFECGYRVDWYVFGFDDEADAAPSEDELPLMTDERAAERAAYIAAFTAANGHDPDFALDWEAGWWCVRHGQQRPVRYRSQFLKLMTARLLARAAEQRR